MLEVIVAIGITIAGIVGTVALMISTSRLMSASQTQIIATNLAREGIEVARGIRDSNWLKIDSGISGIVWNTGLSNGSGYTAIPTFDDASGEWSLDFTPATIGDDAAVLKRNSSTGMYNQASGDLLGYQKMPQFQRLLTLNPLCWDNDRNESGDTGSCTGDQVGVAVHSVVRWTEHGHQNTIELVDKLYDWKQ